MKKNLLPKDRARRKRVEEAFEDIRKMKESEKDLLLALLVTYLEDIVSIQAVFVEKVKQILKAVEPRLSAKEKKPLLELVELIRRFSVAADFRIIKA